MMTNRVRLQAGWIVRGFGLAILLLVAAHGSLQWVRHQLGLGHLYGLVRLFDMGGEANLPTFVADLQMLAVGAVLAAIGLVRREQGDGYARHWLFLALIFFLLAADEASEMHELTIRPLRELAPWLVTGLFYWAWVLPATVLFLLLSFSYAGFVFRYLPPETRRSTVIGATLFVGGALGVEMPEARFVQQHGMDNLTYASFVLVEETMEMCGILVFLSGLLSYCARHLRVLEVEVVRGGPPPAR